ncbi:MAG: Fe-S cluster assembly ATPase SufC [Chloroflexi bacterium]|nr:Fe-S cluster assembly ATPase SufC [Chloroflexota bacterium]
MSDRTPFFVVEDLWVAVEGKEILKGVNLSVAKGEVHAIMGPNGSGKSTFAHALMGHPRYTVTRGRVLMNGEDVLSLKPDERARRGIFLAFQYPSEVPGVPLDGFLRTAVKSRRGEDIPVLQFRRLLIDKMKLLRMEPSFAKRYVNEGFSGGEKKRNEILQMALLEPEIAILDETDSGLDIDALRIVAEGVNQLIGPNLGVLLITHYQRILNYITPNFVHVMISGRIVRSGGQELAAYLEQHGYDAIRQELEQSGELAVAESA